MEAAFEALNQAIRLEPDNANGYSNRGNAFNNAKKYDRAIEDYNEALRLKPDFAQVFSDRGAAWYFKGEYQKAIADYDEALRLEPHRARTYSNRSAAYRKLGRTERAIEDVSAAIRIDPTQPEFFDNRGLDLAGNGDYARAIADYDEAIKIRPEAKFLTNRGDAYQARKDYDRAIADYDAALKLDPKFQRAYNNRGAAWVKKGDRGRALQDYAEAVRLNPSDSTAAANHKDVAQEIERLGSLSYQKNLPSFNCATAKRQVEKAICADPGLAQLDRNINDVFLRVIASAESDSHRAALALTRQQRDFIEKRNSLVRQAVATTSARRWRTGWRSSIRSPGSRVLAERPVCSWLDLAQLPVTMPGIKCLPSRHGRACPGHPRLAFFEAKQVRGCPAQARA